MLTIVVITWGLISSRHLGQDVCVTVEHTQGTGQLSSISGIPWVVARTCVPSLMSHPVH